MVTRLFSFLFCILLLTTISLTTAYADQQPNPPSFFSFLKEYLLTYTATTHKQTLAAHVDPTVLPPTTQPLPQSAQISDVSAYLLQGVNEYRSSLGLSQVQSSAETCAFAAVRAKEISGGFNHDGFNNRVANHTIPYATWTRATENIAQAPDYKEVVTLWKNSPEHAANMRDNTPYVCIEQYDSYYAYEGMRL
ncbi:MAG TPA: CAP domain-containing protein [Candidatus Saccharimonadales bacterium]|nr:CAP domain-containing protein [Candidatus Saccharimonadales bacterium]